MSEAKTKLQDNPRGSLEQYITALQSESKMARKKALNDINTEIFENVENVDCDLTVIFPEIYAYMLKSFSDPSEACRDAAATIMSNFIEKLPLNDYYLTYIVPVIVRRIGCPEIVEESEEIRLVLISLVQKILDKYKVSHLLSPFINDFTSILTKTVTDPYPKVKLVACECIIQLTKILQRDFHFQSESYVKPVLSNFAHQHFRVRVAAVRAIGAIVLAGNAKCFELSVSPMAEKLFDENIQVRLQVTLEVGNWMLSYRDRYSFWHRMIPLLLTSLSDVMADIRETANKLWMDVGLQYMEENEEDLKKKADFLKDVPTHYPDVKRPNLGCRTLVMSNIGKIVPAICREMDGWQADARLRVSQLLCWLILCAEEGSTQHALTIVRSMLRGASDDDARVVLEVKRAAELFGYFITPDTWWPLLEAEMDSWPALLVLANILKGSRAELVKPKAMGEICQELSDPDRCRTRKPKYQTNLLNVCEALMDLCGEDVQPLADQLFTINFTVYSMPVDDQIAFMALSNLDKLRFHEKCGRTLTSLYEKHIGRVLAGITSDAVTWTLLTPDRCLLESALLHSGSAMGAQLHLIAPLLKECLATPKVDPEVKLKIFTTLSTVLLKRQDNFVKCDTDKLEAFLKIVIEEVIMSNLVWSAGRTAEAIRTAAVACLCAALQEKPEEDASATGAHGDNNDEVNLFPTKESLEPFLERMVPLLAALVDDNSALTRQHTLRAVCYLASLAKLRGCFTVEILHKIYFVVLKRLDDSSDKVRSFAVQTICTLFKCRPVPYDTVVFGAHIDALYSAMLIHLDDPDEMFRKEMLDFKGTLPQISASIKKADFLVIDTEFTGLVSGRDVSVFDSPKEYYKCLLNGSTEFIVIQYGLCAFYWDEERKHYMNDAFNFYLFPRAKHGPEKFFLCQSSSLDFLIAQGFDFNKMIRDGISYMTEPVETRLREQLTEKQRHTKEKEKENIIVPDEHKAYILETRKKVRMFLDDGKEDEMTIDKCNSFLRLLLYQELKLHFKDEILLNTEILENKNRVLKVLRVKSNTDEINLTKQKKEKEWEELEDSVGFSKVARMISQSGKLVIGHNMLLDVIHTLNNFFQPLPDDYHSFKEYAHFVFPSLLDTKYMSSLPPFKDKVNSSVLHCLLATFSEAPFSIPKVGSYEGRGYKTAQDKHHEAGYDAYITGLCFLSMHEHLSRMRGEQNARFSPSSPLLKPFLNKLFLAKTAHQESPYMNLAGADPAPSRDHVFYLTFPREWTRNDINLMFSPYGPITCYFVDETHAIIALMRRDQAQVVVRGLASCPRVTLVPYEQYKEKSYLKVDHKASLPEANCNKIQRAMAITNSSEVKNPAGSVPNVASSNSVYIPEKVPRVRTNNGTAVSPPHVATNSTRAKGATPPRARTNSTSVTSPPAVQARKRTSSGVFQVDAIEPPPKKSEHTRPNSDGTLKRKLKKNPARPTVEQSGSGDDDKQIIKIFDGTSKSQCVSAFKESASWD